MQVQTHHHHYHQAVSAHPHLRVKARLRVARVTPSSLAFPAAQTNQVCTRVQT